MDPGKLSQIAFTLPGLKRIKVNSYAAQTIISLPSPSCSLCQTKLFWRIVLTLTSDTNPIDQVVDLD